MLIDVTISEAYWSRFNKRKATVSSFSYFNLSNDFIFDVELLNLGCEQRMVFIWFLCRASSLNSLKIREETDLICTTLRIPKDEISDYLNDLNNIKHCEISGHVSDTCQTPLRHVSDTSAPRKKERKKETKKERQNISPIALSLVEVWNANCGSDLPRARGCNKSREQKVLTRLKEEPSLEYWEEVVRKIAASDFCCGYSDGGWKASFDWILQPDVHLKVMEGKYDNRTTPKVRPKSFEEQLREAGYKTAGED